LLLQKNEYKLWRIVDNQPLDSIKWHPIGTFKLESFWDECEEKKDCWDAHCEYDYVLYQNCISTFEKPRIFRKKNPIPEYLYIDKDGYVCVVYFDKNRGNFFEKPDSDMTGFWKLKTDSIIIINNKSYIFRQTDNKISIILNELNSEKTIKIVETNFPYICNRDIVWSGEAEKGHLKKWGFGITNSPLLQGFNFKLWRDEQNLGFLWDDELIYSQGKDYLSHRYYYCMFKYFDKFGRYADIAFTEDKWDISEHFYPRINNDDLVSVTSWYPNGNDSTFCGYRTMRLSYTHPDTLQLHDVKTDEEFRWIAINLPPKSKWKESGKR